MVEAVARWVGGRLKWEMEEGGKWKTENSEGKVWAKQKAERMQEVERLRGSTASKACCQKG
jgi:hypothetical protein